MASPHPRFLHGWGFFTLKIGNAYKIFFLFLCKTYERTLKFTRYCGPFKNFFHILYFPLANVYEM